GFTGLTQESSGNTGGSAGHVTIDSEYKIVSATGTQTADQTSTAENWAAAVVTYKSKCGNGTVDSGESCDAGAAHGTSTSCCSATCTVVSSATVCPSAAGTCDVAESCTGSSANCPADTLTASGTVCR